MPSSLWEELNSGPSNVTYSPAPNSTTTTVVHSSSVSGTTVEYYTRQIAQLQQEINVLRAQNSAIPTQMQQEMNVLRAQLQVLQEQNTQLETSSTQQRVENARQADIINEKDGVIEQLRNLLGQREETLHKVGELLQTTPHQSDTTHQELVGLVGEFMPDGI